VFGFSVARSTGFDRFNWGFDKVRQGGAIAQLLVRIRVIVLAVFVALLVLTGWLYTVVPGFLPTKIKAISSVLFKQRGFAELHQRYPSGGNRTAEAAGNASNFWWL